MYTCLILTKRLACVRGGGVVSCRDSPEFQIQTENNITIYLLLLFVVYVYIK